LPANAGTQAHCHSDEQNKAAREGGFVIEAHQPAQFDTAAAVGQYDYSRAGVSVKSGTARLNEINIHTTKPLHKAEALKSWPERITEVV